MSPTTSRQPENLLPEIEEAVERRDAEALRTLTTSLHHVDIARLLRDFGEEDEAWLIGSLDEEIRGEVLLELPEAEREDVLQSMAEEPIRQALRHLDSDEAADLLQDLDAERVRSLLDNLEDDERREVEQLLIYGEETAGGIMQVELFKVRESWDPVRIMEVLRRFAADLNELHGIFVVDDDNVLTGALDFQDLILAEPDRPILEAANRNPVSVTPEVDQEEVAHLFRKYDLISLPVVDHDHRLLGRITADDVFDVIHEEASEDIYRLGGVEDDDLEESILRTAYHRGSWLIVNLFTAGTASWVISRFDATLSQLVAVAVLMPIVASMGGNAGTQSLTVVVRAIALGRITTKNGWPIVFKEAVAGFLNGFIFAVIVGSAAALWFPELGFMLGLAIGLALIVNLCVSGIAGSLVPLGLRGVGIDPALASPILLTMVTDVIGFFSFLFLAELILL